MRQQTLLRIAAIVALSPIQLGEAGTCWSDPGPSHHAFARPSITGITGLVRVPTAEVAPDGHAILGLTSPRGSLSLGMGGHTNAFVGMTFLPRLETVLSLGSVGTTRDATAHLKLLVVEGTAHRPAIALGLTDLGQNRGVPSTGETAYAVATLPFARGTASITAGLSVGGTSGPIGGLRLTPVSWCDLVAEYDTRFWNTGLVVRVANGIWLRLARIDIGTIGGVGVGFRVSGPAMDRRHVAEARSPALEDDEALRSIRDSLVALGFEDVRVQMEQGAGGMQLAVLYENRRFTIDERDGFQAAVSEVAPLLPSGVRRLALRAYRRGIPIAQLSLSTEEAQRYVTGKASLVTASQQVLPAPDRSRAVVAYAPTANPSAGHVELAIGPGFRNQIGTEQGQFRVGLQIRPEVDVRLPWRLAAYARWSAPLGGELVRHDARRLVNEASVLSHVFQPLSGWAAQVSAGRFPELTDAAVLELLKPLGSRGVGYVVAGVVDNPYLRRQLYAIGSYWQMLPAANVQIRVLGGRFLTNDNGAGIDVLRHFSHTVVGAGYRHTSRERLLRVMISVPLSPRRQWQRPALVRVRLPDYFDYSVSTIMTRGQNLLSLAERTGQELRLGSDLVSMCLSRNRLLTHTSWLYNP